MSELPQPKPGQEWKADPTAYDELAAVREQHAADQAAAEAARRAELQAQADAKYPRSAESDDVAKAA